MRHDKIQRLASDEPLAYAPLSTEANQTQRRADFADHRETSPRSPHSRLTSPRAPLKQSHIWQAQIWRRALLRQALILTALVALAVLLRARILALDLPADPSVQQTLVHLAPLGAVGLLILVVAFGVSPTSPPIDVMLIILAVIMAASVIVTVPLVILVLIFQRKIVAGLTAGGVKG